MVSSNDQGSIRAAAGAPRPGELAPWVNSGYRSGYGRASMNILDLDLIAARLEALEETIIHRFIDRAQFARNAQAYERGASGFAGAGNESLFELRLAAQERMDAEFGRYEVPEERPVLRELPRARRKVHMTAPPLAVDDYNVVSRSRSICGAFIAQLPLLCKEPDDGQYGSSVEHDVAAIQAIARRVHYGALFVAEAKYRRSPREFAAAASSNDRRQLVDMLTRAEVEAAIIARLADKVQHLQAHVNRRVRRVIGAEVVVEFYRDTIIPLTKEGQVEYLLARRREP